MLIVKKILFYSFDVITKTNHNYIATVLCYKSLDKSAIAPSLSLKLRSTQWSGICFYSMLQCFYWSIKHVLCFLFQNLHF